MADERVVIKIDINADTSAIDRVQRKLRALAAEAELANQRMRGLNSSLDDNADAADKVDKSHTRAAKSVNDHGSSHDRFSKRLKKNEKDLDLHQKMVKGLASVFGTTLKFGLIGAGIEMAAMGIALSTVNGLLGIGQFAVKAYKVAMQGLAQGAAAAIIAVSTLVAAQREYNASIVAFQYKSAPQLGKGTAQAMSAMRNLTSDTRLGVFGMKNLSAAFAAVSKNAEMTGGLQNALAGVGDFAVAAGGDIGKNLTAAADFLGLLQKEGSLTEDVLSSASKVGPQFAAAIEQAKKNGLTGASDIISALSSGDLAKQAGLEGALAGVNDTLIGQLKSFMTGMQTQFGDLGQRFLPQVKVAFDQIASSLRVAFTRISGVLTTSVSGGMIENLAKGIDKVIYGVTTLFVKYLPMTQKFFEPFIKGFESVSRFFRGFSKDLQGLSGGAKVITDTFGPVLITIVKNFGESLGTLSRLAEENKDEFAAFGDALANIFTAVQNAFNTFKEIVMANLPLITGVFNVLASAINGITSAIGFLIGGLGKLSGVAGALGTLGLISGLVMAKGAINNFTGKKTLSGAVTNKVQQRFVPGQGKGGGISQSVGTMYVTASTVHLTQGTVPGRTQPGVSTSGLNRGGGVGSTPYGPSMPGKPPPPTPKPSFGARLSGSRLGQSRFGQGVAANGKTGVAIAGMGALFAGAGEEASPFLAAGAGIGMINPLAGLAVGGLGTAATAKTAGGGAVAGALGGAAAGALIGTALGGPVVGTAIGAALGLGFGAVMGNINADRGERKKEKGFAQATGLEGGGEMMKALYEGGPKAALTSVSKMQDQMRSVTDLEKEYSKVNGRNATQAERTAKAETELREGRINQAQYDAVTKEHMGTYMKELRKQNDALGELSDQAVPEYIRKMDHLTTVTGKSESDLTELAQKMGVDLTDGTMSLSGALEKLGLATVQTTDDIKASLAGLYAQDVENIFGTRIKKRESEQAINQAAEGLAQVGAGNVSQEQMDKFLQTAYTEALGAFGGDSLKAAQYLSTSIGTAQGNQFSGEGPLAGFAETFAKFGAFGDIAEILKTQQTAAVDKNLVALTTGLTKQGIGMGPEQVEILRTSLTTALQTDPANGQKMLEVLNRIATSGVVDPITGQKNTGETGAASLEYLLTQVGLPIIDAAGTKVGDDAASATQTALSTAATDMKTKITEAINTQPSWWNNQPSWWNNGQITVSGSVPMNNRPPGGEDRDGDPTTSGDTATSRLGRTMARHSFYDGMLGGSRTVTSSLRNTNVGSTNSDHVTGAAYDLTGQNLGAYSSLVNGSGGFAEFHGAGGSRHLHVVPGQTPIGDTMSPVASSGVAVMNGGSSSYSITINTQPGQDANAIAQEVMARIDERDRSNRERQ